MACLPAPVTIVTTVDEHGAPCGFTASAVCSLSMDPPLVMVGVSRTSSCFDALATASRFVVNVLARDHGVLATRFATPGIDRFGGGELVIPGPGQPPHLPDALASVWCTKQEWIDAGDHVIVVGRVADAVARPGEPLVWHQRGFLSS
jgi:flavin reductase ActVB